MKNLIFLVIALLLVGMTACTAGGTVTTSSTPTVTPPDQEPVEVVSVTGPMPPFNPGGPTVEIVLENISAEPIVYLTATLSIDGSLPSGQFTFSFGVGPASPLVPGEDVIGRATLIGGGISSDALYPLAVSGSFQDNEPFSYTTEVKVSPPPVSTTGT